MRKIGFLHTSPVHVPTFNKLLEHYSQAGQLVHLVDEPLLAEAMSAGITEAVERQVADHIQQLVSAGCDAIVCTCSTIGGIAEQVQAAHVLISRIDRPMAAHAVQNSHVILMVAAIRSTLAPTRDLLLDESNRQKRPVRIQELVLDEAWIEFLAGDLKSYYRMIADGIREYVLRDGGCEEKLPPEVIVLAQASMAPAAQYLSDIDLPILTSPEMCAASLLSL